MSAFEVEKIVPHVRRVLDAPEAGWCATIEIAGRDEAWAQVMKGTLNAAYPLGSKPDVGVIAAELPGASIDSWEAGSFVTYAFEGAAADAVARALDRHFQRYFAPGEYPVECRVENLDG